MTKGFAPLDFRLWYDGNRKMIKPLLDAMLKTTRWNTIVATGDALWEGEEQAAAEKKVGKGFFRICQINLPGRVNYNPAAYLFARRLMQKQ